MAWYDFFKVLSSESYVERPRKRKGIVLAAGKGTRLQPLTLAIPKALLPVKNRFLIDYSLDMLWMYDTAIVVNPEQAGLFMKVYGNKYTYIVQEEANGIAGALDVCRKWVGDSEIVVMLGDTIFENKYTKAGFPNFKGGARCWSYEVENPYWCGCVEREDGEVVNLVEKPGEGYTKSREVLIGLYEYDNTVWDRIDDLEYSDRGELEITDLNKSYLATGELTVMPFNGLWYDAGTDMESYLGAWQIS